jgi:hypothetical protein
MLCCDDRRGTRRADACGKNLSVSRCAPACRCCRRPSQCRRRDSNPHALSGACALNAVCIPFHHHGMYVFGDSVCLGTRIRTWIRGFKGHCSAVELSPSEYSRKKRPPRSWSQRRESNSRRHPYEGRASPRAAALLLGSRDRSRTGVGRIMSPTWQLTAALHMNGLPRSESNTERRASETRAWNPPGRGKESWLALPGRIELP